MKFMTRRTQRNIISQYSSVMAIYVSPLDTAWSCLLCSTSHTRNWRAKLSAYPVVKTAVAYMLTLPAVMFVAHCFRAQGLNTLLGQMGIYLGSDPIWFTPLDQLLIPDFRIANTRTVVTWFYLRRRSAQLLTAVRTVDFNHIFSLPQSWGNAI